MSVEAAKGVGTEVGQLVVFPIAPQIFDRIELGSVGREILEVNLAVLRADEVLDESTPVLAQAVPDDQQFVRQRSLQAREKVDHLRTADRARIQTEVEIPPGHPGNRRECLPVEAVLQDRCLASRGPRSAAVGLHTQPALVDEDEDAPLPAGFFLIPGHIFFRQV